MISYYRRSRQSRHRSAHQQQQHQQQQQRQQEHLRHPSQDHVISLAVPDLTFAPGQGEEGGVEKKNKSDLEEAEEELDRLGDIPSKEDGGGGEGEGEGVGDRMQSPNMVSGNGKNSGFFLLRGMDCFR